MKTEIMFTGHFDAPRLIANPVDYPPTLERQREWVKRELPRLHPLYHWAGIFVDCALVYEYLAKPQAVLVKETKVKPRSDNK